MAILDNILANSGRNSFSTFNHSGFTTYMVHPHVSSSRISFQKLFIQDSIDLLQMQSLHRLVLSSMQIHLVALYVTPTTILHYMDLL